ncbi:3-isopropylmalate dehydratase small subunit [Hyella patelloides LEGE 07179]|uniref:3-isopropylmalate dehydratase small subunit n=1 Tax=Hyella patelloides LEGE 07179 TaxID=945734 RepID=A0A563W435_9CYAN|nr:3-isopropylmalate dehydratase small subunit [Hyella patelloides]VEP18410.1 3-isopropylmalate dehydratase small subunit [Hyella patelloides LEGE 07179]
MSQIKQVLGKGVPVVGNDIDTDRIIPARFLRCVTFDGLGEQAFVDDRAQSNGKHPFDRPQYQDANILVVNGNFGCGSSREHAPQSLSRWGIKGIIGESFAEIFFGNCIAIGLPCVTLDRASVQQIQKAIQDHPNISVTIDLEKMQVTCGDAVFKPSLSESAKQMFLRGTWDNCGQLNQNVAAIQETASKLPYIAWNAS